METKKLAVKIFIKAVVCIGLLFSSICGIFTIVFSLMDKETPKFMRVAFVIGCFVSVIFNICNYIKSKKMNIQK